VVIWRELKIRRRGKYFYPGRRPPFLAGMGSWKKCTVEE